MRHATPKLFSFAHSRKLLSATGATASTLARASSRTAPAFSPQLRHEDEANRECVLI